MPDRALTSPDTPCVVEIVRSTSDTELRVKTFDTLPDAQAYLDSMKASGLWDVVKNSVYPAPVLWKEIVGGRMKFIWR